MTDPYDDPYTSERRMCDDDGLVTGDYLVLHNYLAWLTYAAQGRPEEWKPIEGGWTCTSHAHLAGEHIRCSSPAHDIEPEEFNEAYGLLMPFVVVESTGGPYDDRSFVAGARYGDVANALRAKPFAFESYEYPELVPQLELLAMHEGYTLTYEPWVEYPDEWTFVRFQRITTPDVLYAPETA